MQAVARPGRTVSLEARLQPPLPLHATSAAVALVLCDFQTPIWLSPALRSGQTVHYLRFQTGAPIAERPADAHFIFISAAELPDSLSCFASGTHEYPDRSATLVIQVKGFNTGSTVLSGPGIKGEARFGVDGLTRSFWRAMSENHGRFPTGVDVIFAAPESLAAVPRSTAVKVEETF